MGWLIPVTVLPGEVGPRFVGEALPSGDPTVGLDGFRRGPMCDSLVTITGEGVLFAKNSDRDPNEAQPLEWVPAADHQAGSALACTWMEIPQVSHTHAVLVSRPWWMWGAEMGANQHGLVIGNEAVFTRRLRSSGASNRSGWGRTSGTAPGETSVDRSRDQRSLLGMDLVRLALERAVTAEEAVGVIVGLLERYGQGGPCSFERPDFTYDNSFLVADPSGAFVLETSGTAWEAEAVTGPGRSISNGLSIPAFAKAHGDPLRTWKSQGPARRRMTQPLACQASGPADLMEALRSHGATTSPRWSPVHGGLGAPCVHAGGIVVSSQTTASWVSDLRNAPRHWATASSAPCTSLFKPVEVDQPVDLGPAPSNTFDAKSVWWRHELLHRSTLRAHGTLMPRFRRARDRTEARWLAESPSSRSAFAEADRLEQRWLGEVSAAHLADTRPSWVRRRWKAVDRAAGIEVSLSPRGAATFGP